MTDDEIIRNILEAGYKASKKDGLFNIYEISKDWGEEQDRVDGLVSFMSRKGWVRRVETGGGMEITKEGIYEYERKHEEK